MMSPEAETAPGRRRSQTSVYTMRFTWHLVGIATTFAAPASEGAFRCRDRDPLCDEWKGRGECERNYEFMAETCPSACGYCEAAGFLPTPSPFQLDFVCNGQLSIAPKQITAQHDERMPDGCGFACRDNMTTCAAMKDLCSKHPGTMRFQCPETCGVCKGIGLTGGGYPKHVCRLETGDAPEDAEHCGGWASRGEVRRASHAPSTCTRACTSRARPALLCKSGVSVCYSPFTVCQQLRLHAHEL